MSSSNNNKEISTGQYLENVGQQLNRKNVFVKDFIALAFIIVSLFLTNNILSSTLTIDTNGLSMLRGSLFIAGFTLINLHVLLIINRK